MKYIIDTEQSSFSIDRDGKIETLDLYSKRSFEILSEKWLKLGWNEKYSYTFTWLGRPIIQLPEDVLRIQEVIYQVKPDVIIETGVAYGGSLVFYASLCKAMGIGRVIGVDVEIRKKNREEIETHFLFPWITLIEGNSVDLNIVAQVKNQIRMGEKVLVILDSNHSKNHVKDELDVYHPLVSSSSYIVVTDGIMKDLASLPHGSKDWAWNNPLVAVTEFVEEHPEFELTNPKWSFNESNLTECITYWPSAWLKRN